jgi:hypothetical protein
LVPSAKNEKMSCLLAVAVIVGAVPDGHFTVVHVTVLLPVASCLRRIINDLPAVAVGMVIVALPVSVSTWKVPFTKLIVIAVPVLAV